MAATLTTAGTTHIAERVAGTSLTNAFGALELGQGNDTPAVGDDRSDLTSKIADTFTVIADGYPVLLDTDIRNDGRGATIWTWKFVIPQGEQFVASNLIVTNYAAGAPSSTEPVLVHADTVVAKRADQEATVFVNVSTVGAVTIVVHVEAGEPLVEQLASWRQQSISLSGAPGATAVSGGVVQSRLNEGEQAWTASRMLDGEGGVLTATGVESVTLSAYRRVREREWSLDAEYALGVFSVFTTAPVRIDMRWRGSQGYTFHHAWVPPSSWGSRRTRLEYRITLLTGEVRTLVHEIEWASMRTQ